MGGQGGSGVRRTPGRRGRDAAAPARTGDRGARVGTGLNTHAEFGQRVAQALSLACGTAFVCASNKFEALAAHDRRGAHRSTGGALADAGDSGVTVQRAPARAASGARARSEVMVDAQQQRDELRFVQEGTGRVLCK
jgi:Lyase